MELINKVILDGDCFCTYYASFPVSLENALKFVYRVSFSGYLLSAYESVNEPYGVDSDWRHECGDLIGDLSESDFLQKYSNYDAVDVFVAGIFEEARVSVGVLPKKEVVRLAYPETFPVEKVENLVKVVDTICNEMAEEQ